MGTATVTVAAFSPTASADQAFDHLDRLRTGVLGWQQTRHEAVEVCGQRGIRVAGTATGAGLDMHYEYVELAYDSGGTVYPIQVAGQVRIADLPRYASDLDTILGGVRVVP
ncbi:hypothetical protein [Nocardia lijiangensis]|uniref:hypothetical protein n=1 Tax=Nocardia lijiangensis TaxID=299618 RepID=UPI000A8E6766|nr:hypothetical protein [Nocardia lijiangensis]